MEAYFQPGCFELGSGANCWLSQRFDSGSARVMTRWLSCKVTRPWLSSRTVDGISQWRWTESIDEVLRSRNVEGLKGLNIGARGVRSTRATIKLHNMAEQDAWVIAETERRQ